MTARTNVIGFLDLPLELRIEIYEFSLLEEVRIFINGGWPGPNRDLITALKDLGETEANEIWRIYYRKTKFRYLLTNLESGTFDYAGLIRRLEELSPTERRYLHEVEVICFFSTPDRVAVAKEAIAKWLRGGDRKLQDGVVQFSEKYWCRQIV